MAKRLAKKRSKRFVYFAAVMASFGIVSMAVLAVYYRFWWQMEGGEVSWSKMFGTFALLVGATIGIRGDMGRFYLISLEGSIYSYKYCHAHLAVNDDIISKFM